MIPHTAPAAGWRRSLIGASVAGVVGTVVSLAGAPGAFAAGDYLEFSLDGETFTSTVAGPVFGESIDYVPGGTSSATLWVRNNSEDSARLSSAALVVRSDPEMNNYLGLRTGKESGLSTRTSLGGSGSCTDLQDAWELKPGEERVMRLVLDLAVDAPNDTMNRSADFDVVFLLESTDAVSRTACAALGNPTQPPGESGTTANTSGPTGARGPSEVTALQGTRGMPQPAPNSVFPAALPERGDSGGQANEAMDAGLPQAGGPAEQNPQAAIIPAGFQSTVEPIIRTLQGTLLIAMSVLLAAAAVLRFRKRQLDE